MNELPEAADHEFVAHSFDPTHPEGLAVPAPAALGRPPGKGVTVPLPEYPRPQLVRDSYLNLNGRWEYAITERPDEPEDYDGEILVPFSPEAPLSGVGRQLRPGQTLWYRRTLELPAGFRRPGHRILLHLGAVDQVCSVRLGAEVGSHTGGYLPFAVDITDALDAGETELVVVVQDSTEAGVHSRGKQRLDRGGIWYTAQSGIWQTVWAESVPPRHVERLTLTPDLDGGALQITVHTSPSATPADDLAEITVRADGEVVGRAVARAGEAVEVPLSAVRPWSPEDPFLYDVAVRLGDDEVGSYAGLRSFGVGHDDAGHPRLLLNGRPYFHAGVLDQGYWPDGLYTAPTDAALVADIDAARRFGFTMIRKHIKIEPLRWYYHCDRLGILVWQDLVNGGATAPVIAPPVDGAHLDDRAPHHLTHGRGDAAGRAEFRAEVRATVEHLRNVVSLAVWVPFNEGWGQFDAADVAAEMAVLDPTRTVDHASGWHDQGAGDLRSLHVYARAFRAPEQADGRVLALTEYGGYALPVPGHTWTDEPFGYRTYADADELATAFRTLHEEEIVPAMAQGLAAAVYTQLTDVEDEVNGLLTYDREVVKLPAEVVRQVVGQLRY